MKEETEWKEPAQEGRVDWRAVFVVALLTSFFLVLLSIAPAFDIWTVLYLLIAGPMICLFLLIFAAVRRSWTGLAVAGAFVAASLFIAKEQNAIRDSGRWLLGSGAWKARVLEQTEPDGQEFKHLEWDGWGFAGNDTSVYLVYDPQERLRAAVRSGFQGRWNAELCGISAIRRLERGWYSVVFYTDTGWGDCGLVRVERLLACVFRGGRGV